MRSVVSPYKDGKVHLGDGELLDAFRRLSAPDDGLRRQLSSISSWMRNVGSNTTPTLHVHTSDAEAHGLQSGDEAELSTTVGSVRVAVEVADQRLPGVISYPHGWRRSGAELQV